MIERIVRIEDKVAVDAEGNVCMMSKIVGEVVRCKDCAIRYDACPMVVRAGNTVAFFTDDNDFCSRGRRKGEEE